MIKLITFDLDDTLWPIKPTLIRAEKNLFEWFKQHAPKLAAKADSKILIDQRKALINEKPELQHSVTAWRLEAQRRALVWAGYGKEEAEELNQEAFKQFMVWRNQVTLYPGAEEAIQELAKTYKVGAITNGNADIFKQGVGQYFDFSISADEIGVSKPAPEPFLAALKLGGVSASECIHVGDCPKNDIAPAKAMGMIAIQALMDQTGIETSMLADSHFEEWPTLLSHVSLARDTT